MVFVSASGISCATQAVALLRQIIIVSAFGLTRELDLYSTVFAILSFSILPMAVIVETTFISMLGAVRENYGAGALGNAVRTYASASFVLSAGIVCFVAGLLPVLVLPFVAGFNEQAQASLLGLAPYSLLWALLVLPHVAISACLKVARSYHAAFMSDLTVSVISTAAIYLSHNTVADVVLAYGYGYAAGVLFSGYFVLRLRPRQEELVVGFPWLLFIRRALRHFTSTQVGMLSTLAERFWFSYLPAGGIAALALVQQLVMSLSGLLSFRDAYLVPLSNSVGRERRLAQLLLSLLLMSVVTAVGVIALAEPICQLLFEYGKTAARDTALLAKLLQIGMVAMVFSVVSTPVWRMQQMMGIYRPLTFVYLGQALLIMVLGWFVINRLGLGTIGMALVSVIVSAVATLVAVIFAWGYSIRPRLIEYKLFFLVLFACCVAGGVATGVVKVGFSGPLQEIIVKGGVYTVCVCIFSLFIRRSLLSLIGGTLGYDDAQQQAN